MAIAASPLLRQDGWPMNEKRVYWIWRREGLKVPQKQPKRERLWLNDGSCVRLRPHHSGHVWSYDFVMDRTHDGKPFRMLCVIDEFTRECLAIRAERKLNARIVLETLADLFLLHGPPEHIRSDNGPEFVETAPAMCAALPTHHASFSSFRCLKTSARPL
jgi:putative transposase